MLSIDCISKSKYSFHETQFSLKKKRIVTLFVMFSIEERLNQNKTIESVFDWNMIQ